MRQPCRRTGSLDRSYGARRADARTKTPESSDSEKVARRTNLPASVDRSIDLRPFRHPNEVRKADASHGGGRRGASRLRVPTRIGAGRGCFEARMFSATDHDPTSTRSPQE